MDARIFALLARVNGETDDERRAALKRQTDEELGEHFARHRQDMEELAYDLLNLAWADALAGDLVGQVINVVNVGLGDTSYVEEDLRGMRAYWQGKGGLIRSDIIRAERLLMPREEMVTAIDLHQDEITLNFWGSFDKLQAQAQEKLRTLPVERLIELVQAAVTTGVTFGEFATATLTDTQVDSVLDPVAIKSKGKVTLLGTQVGVRRLANVGLDFGPNIQEKIFETGQIGTYKGYPVVQAENFEDFQGLAVLPNDEIWIVGYNAGQLTYYGPSAKVQQLAQPSFFIRWETARDAGMSLYGAAKGRLGRIVLT